MKPVLLRRSFIGIDSRNAGHFFDQRDVVHVRRRQIGVTDGLSFGVALLVGARPGPEKRGVLVIMQCFMSLACRSRAFLQNEAAVFLGRTVSGKSSGGFAAKA